ncbi:hypothetical protein BDZ88DRAFT_81724 [Geranomyces variabilis]|nr:hypothetical protein BDZ88DRAFT_81724 [Geranomyces variabilis]
MQLLSRQSRLHAFAALLLALPAITRAQQPTSPAAAASSACQPSTLVSQACGVVRDLDLATSVSAADAAAADAQLQTIVAGLKPLENIAPACYGYLRQIYCGSVYPGCRNGITVYPCATACQFATDSCMTILTVLGKEHMLPDCAQGIAPSGNATRVPYPTTQCLGSAAPGAKIAVLDSQATAMATALPATVYSDGVDTQVIILMALCESLLRDASQLLAWFAYSCLLAVLTWHLFLAQILFRFLGLSILSLHSPACAAPILSSRGHASGF